MTAPSIREALEAALKYYDSLEREHAPGEAELLDRIQATLAAPPQDVVEGIARIIDPETFQKYDKQIATSRNPKKEKKWADLLFERKLKPARDKATATLASGLVTAANPDEAAIRADEREKCGKPDLLAVMEQECWTLRCIDIPTGGGDADVGWEVIEHHMAEPHDRRIGFGSTPVEAIEDAIRAGGAK